MPISRCTRPHPLSRELKNRLGLSFQESRPLSGLAHELGTSPAVLSRLFRRDWGKPPVQFRNWLRVMESFRHLAERKAVTETAFEAGFNDLHQLQDYEIEQRFDDLTSYRRWSQQMVKVLEKDIGEYQEKLRAAPGGDRSSVEWRLAQMQTFLLYCRVISAW